MSDDKNQFTLKSLTVGFPSPAEDHVTDSIDINRYLIKHPAATFFMRVAGNSMQDDNIFDNDILIVDRSIDPTAGKFVIAVIDNELVIRRLQKTKDGKFFLASAKHSSTELQNLSTIWGVVTTIIHLV